MSWFDKIKYYYDNGLWDKQRVRNVVGKVLTAEEYKTITEKKTSNGYETIVT